MKAKSAVVLFAVMLALASAAAIGVILPENYPTPEPVQPQSQQTVPVSAQAPIPVAPQPGHPGGIYTQVVVTCYGPIQIAQNGLKILSADVQGNAHVSSDRLTGYVDFASDTRETVQIALNIKTNNDVKTVYITANAPSGVEVNFDSTTDSIKHVSPGVWVANAGSDDLINTTMYVYGQPISSGYRYITVTISEM